MKNNKITAVITVIDNDYKYLSDCLKTLYHSCQYAKIGLEIIIIENGIRIARTKFRTLNYRIVHLKNNQGFGKAVNEGFKYVKTKWSIILAPDTKCNINTIYSLIDTPVNMKTAIIGPKIKYANGNLDYSILPEPNIWNIFLEQSYFYKLVPWLFSHPFASGDLYKSNRKVGGVASTFWLINSRIFRRLRGFDRKFFLFFDDTDFCRRIIKKNYHIIYQPLSEITHFGHQSNSGVINGYRLIDGLYIYLRKYHTYIYTFICLNIVLGGSVIRLFYWKCKSLISNKYPVKTKQYKEMVMGILMILNQNAVKQS